VTGSEERENLCRSYQTTTHLNKNSLLGMIKIKHKNLNSRLAFTLIELLVAIAAIAGTSCSKKQQPAQHSKIESAPATAPVEETAAMPPSETASPDAVEINSGTDQSQILVQLTMQLRRYCIEHHQLPASLNDLVTAGYVQNIPPPPPGKRFAIDPDPKILKVIVVSN